MGSHAAVNRAWLDAHPERDETWLEERKADGFEIHHLDENTQNNTPSNLVLIDALDHKRIHGVLSKLAKATNSGRRGAMVALKNMTAEQISARASRASKIRWRKWRRLVREMKKNPELMRTIRITAGGVFKPIDGARGQS